MPLISSLQGTSGESCCASSTRKLSNHAESSSDPLFFSFLVPRNSPLWDPFEFGGDFYENYERMYQLCDIAEKSTDWKDHQIIKAMQILQEDWVDLWVSEMIRIAKPGATILVEEMSPPLCDARNDWGGVEKAFFTERGVPKYKWDIDPESIQFVSWHGRYHVFMTKNQPGEK